jgi:hypothetical protein
MNDLKSHAWSTICTSTFPIKLSDSVPFHSLDEVPDDSWIFLSAFDCIFFFFALNVI